MNYWTKCSYMQKVDYSTYVNVMNYHSYKKVFSSSRIKVLPDKKKPIIPHMSIQWYKKLIY